MRSSRLHLKTALTVYWELASLFFSILAVAVAVLLLFSHRESTTQLLLVADMTACIVFATEFFIGLLRSPKRLEFVQKNWPDLVAAIPLAEPFRWFRLIRILRIRRLFNPAYRERLRTMWTKQAAESFIFMLITSIFPMTFFAIWLILRVEEHAPNANILDLEDATWWFWVTITTVGYGDHYPVTFAGRVLAGAVMVVGIAAFSSLTALLASRLNDRWAMNHPSQQHKEAREMAKQISRLEKLLERQIRETTRRHEKKGPHSD